MPKSDCGSPTNNQTVAMYGNIRYSNQYDIGIIRCEVYTCSRYILVVWHFNSTVLDFQCGKIFAKLTW